jgi:cyclohexadieny/prephenate dehydrogenase
MIAKKTVIIGMGLIGSSLARIIKEKNLTAELWCVDCSEDVCQKVEGLGLGDHVTSSIEQAVEGADFIIIAVPVGAYDDVGKRLRGNLIENCVVSDVGSVKQPVIDALLPHLSKKVHFIPAHPVAGTEHSGPEAGFTSLFENRWCVITPMPETDVRAMEPVVSLWENAGAQIEFMEPARHDLVMAITSHLPHLIAYTIVGTASDLEKHTKEDVIKFSASGFRDFTRIAASDPVMWRDIFISNKDAVLDVLQRFNEDLTALQKAIRNDDGEMLYEFFSRTRNIRKKIIDAGQAEYVYPSGSQEGTPIVEVQEKLSGSRS